MHMTNRNSYIAECLLFWAYKTGFLHVEEKVWHSHFRFTVSDMKPEKCDHNLLATCSWTACKIHRPHWIREVPRSTMTQWKRKQWYVEDAEIGHLLPCCLWSLKVTMDLWKPLLPLTVFLSMDVNKFHNVEDGEKPSLSVLTLLKLYFKFPFW